MSLILFKFFIHPSCERALNNGRVKSKIFRKSSLNFTFGRAAVSYHFARLNSNKTVLLQISMRFDTDIFNSNFAFCVVEFMEPMMTSFCSMI